MDTTIQEYIANQLQDRQAMLTNIHAIILAEDKSVVPVIEPMMRSEMIIYKAKGVMKYGLASVKNYMSLHNLAMYGSKTLFYRYQSLLPKAKFQKGCINFCSAEDMPLDIVRQLIADCSAINLVAIREEYLKEKKAKSKLK